MPNTVDRRVVEMRFDNKEFETNVQSTMTILDKLKDKLSFKNSGKDFTNSGLPDAIDNVKSRFSALEVVGMTALVNLTNSAVNLGKQLTKSLTIDQVKAGFSEYELKMGSIQTIMASTGEDIQTVNKYLNELNTYSDKTIYSFSDMTASIGKFTNAGVDLDTAVKAIQGISNEAAVSGANAQEASRAMYNFAQALSAGYVKLIDWKSIENANMATKEFKQQLIDTAVEMGNLEKQSDGTYKVLTEGATGAFKENITATKNFNDSLSAAWMTTDVLTATLGRYADETTEIGKKAFAAAQDVKTFSQLMDTIKESIGSGWAQTFEIIFGNLEEAKVLWTSVNNIVSEFVSVSSDARNTLLQGWKDSKLTEVSIKRLTDEFGDFGETLFEVGDTGRDVLFKSFHTFFNGIIAFLKPVKEAFREIFPPQTATTLMFLTEKFAYLSKSFERFATFLGQRLQPVLTDVFKAGKDVADLFIDAFKGLFDVINGGGGESALLSIVLYFADFVGWLARGVSAVIQFTRATGIFRALHNILLGLNDVMFGVVESLSAMADGVGDAFSGVLSPIAAVGEAIGDLLAKIDLKKLSIINTIASAIGRLFSLIGKGLSKINFASIGAVLAGGGIVTVAMKASKLLDKVSEKLENLFGKEGEEGGGLMDSVKKTLGSLSDSLNKFQTSLKVGQLITIAAAIGILAISCSTLAGIPAKKLAASVAAIGGLFLELGAASHLMKSANTQGIIAMSIAVAILASAVRKLSEVENMGKGLIGVGVLLGELTAFCAVFDRMKLKPKALAKTGAGLILMAIAINMLAKPVQELGAMDTGSLVKGLTAIGTMLGEFTATAWAFSKIDTKGLAKAGLAMVLMAAAMRMLVKPIKQLGSMKLETLVKGLGALGAALIELAGFTAVMSLIASSTGNILKVSAALLVMSIGIKIMAGAITQMGSVAGAGKGLLVMFGSLVILAGAMALMQKSLAGAAAMIVVAAALAVIAPSIALLSALNFTGVVTGLLALAGTLAIFGAGALILGPVIPLMLALGAAMALLGAGTLALGTGMTLLSMAFATGTSAIVGGIQTIAAGLPIIAKGFGDAILTVLQTLIDGAPMITDAFVAILDMLISAGTTMLPKLVNFGMDMLIALFTGIRDRIEEITVLAIEIVENFLSALGSKAGDLANAGFQFVLSFLNGVADAIANNGSMIINAVWGLIVAVVEAIAGAIPGFGKAAKAALESYRKNLETGGTQAAKSAKKTSENVGKNLQVNDKSTKDFKKSMDTFTKTLDDTGKSASKKAKTMADDTSKSMKIKDQTSNGSNAVRGIIRGMDGQIPSLRSKANQVAVLVDRVIREKNRIQSPSKVLARTGKYLMQGLISGIDSLTPEYQNRAENIATTLIDSTNSAVNAMNAFVSPSLNSTITRTSDVNLRMTDLQKENDKLATGINQLTKTLTGMTDTMNSRSLNVYNTIDGSADPEAFADGLIRSFRLNARTV